MTAPRPEEEICDPLVIDQVRAHALASETVA